MRLINADELLRHKTWINGPRGDSIYDVVFCDEIEEAPTVEAIPKSDYENRLKADLKAILVELQLEIEECVDGAEGSPQFEQGVTTARVQVVEIIQQKINELEGKQDPTPQI